jgi:hypothetical protein
MALLLRSLLPSLTPLPPPPPPSLSSNPIEQTIEYYILATSVNLA